MPLYKEVFHSLNLPSQYPFHNYLNIYQKLLLLLDPFLTPTKNLFKPEKKKKKIKIIILFFFENSFSNQNNNLYFNNLKIQNFLNQYSIKINSNKLCAFLLSDFKI
jgi:hypothetical protein